MLGSWQVSGYLPYSGKTQPFHAFQSHVICVQAAVSTRSCALACRHHATEAHAMKKILLLDACKQFAHSEGRYNAILHDTPLAFLDRAGFDLNHTHIDSG
jgi:hypothetical protein